MKIRASDVLKIASKKTAGFMEPRVEFGKWVEVDGTNGVEAISADFVDMQEVDELIRELDEGNGSIDISGTSLSDYCETSEAYDITVSEGFSAYLSAPGYMDRTENAVFPTEQEAIDFLKDMFPEEFEGEEDFEDDEEF